MEPVYGVSLVSFVGADVNDLTFSRWNFICHFLSHSSKVRRSCWTDSASASQLMNLYSRQSSAKRRGLDALTDSGRSFINARNNSGPELFPVAFQR